MTWASRGTIACCGRKASTKERIWIPRRLRLGTILHVTEVSLMEVLYPCCCGLDVHKDSVVACLIRPSTGGGRAKEIRTFGTTTGELLALEERLERAGRWLEVRVAGEGTGEVARAFVTATLVFCVGAMAIMGAVEDGLGGVPHILYTKAILDGVTSVLFASALGIGVIFSAVPVLLYQGALTLAARAVGGFLTPPVVAELTAAGGLVIVGIGINLLGLARIRTGNLLPAVIFAALIALVVEKLYGA